MIVDSHAHVFPYLGGASGYDSPKAHMVYLQRHLVDRIGVVERKGGAFAAGEDIDFRVGDYGRLFWTKNGVDCHTQWMPPTLKDMTATPEQMIVQMDYVGVDMAVLSRGHVYGQLNDYISECVRRYPSRFIGLAQIDEARADRESEISELRRAIDELDLSGFYYEEEAFFTTGDKDHTDDAKFFPLWEEIVGLGIPVFWAITRHDLNPPLQLEQIKRIGTVLDRFPGLMSVLTHFGTYIRNPKEREKVYHQEDIFALCKRPNVWLELVQVQYPSTKTGDEYPFDFGREMIRRAYKALGAEKLVWGSDMPAVERACTYKQSLDYIRYHCDFIPSADMDLILGENLVTLFGLK